MCERRWKFTKMTARPRQLSFPMRFRTAGQESTTGARARLARRSESERLGAEKSLDGVPLALQRAAGSGGCWHGAGRVGQRKIALQDLPPQQEHRMFGEQIGHWPIDALVAPVEEPVGRRWSRRFPFTNARKSSMVYGDGCWACHTIRPAAAASPACARPTAATARPRQWAKLGKETKALLARCAAGSPVPCPGGGSSAASG